MRRCAGLLLLVGCADGDPADTGDAPAVAGCDPGAEPTLVLGTGDVAFEPVIDHVELVHGPQGGYHVYLGFEATHLDTSEFALAFVEGTIGGEVVARTQPYLDLRCNPETGTQQSWGTLLIYPLTPAELDGQETVITATVTDVTDREVSATLTTTIDDPMLETP